MSAQRTHNLLPFVFDNIPVRGKILHLHNLEQHVPTLGGNHPQINTSLAELLTAAAIMKTDLKSEANVTLQIHSPSTVNMMAAACTADHALKAYAHVEDLAADADLSYAELAAEGSLFACTVNHGAHTQDYQSMVGLDEVSISSSMEKYFAESFQKPTYFKVFTNIKDGKVNTAALFLQMMPESDVEQSSDDWHRLGLMINTLTAEEILSTDLHKEDILNRLFAEDTVRIFDRIELNFNALDTKKRMAQALKKIGQETCKELLAQGPIEMLDEYSGHKHVFDVVDVAEIFGKEWTD